MSAPPTEVPRAVAEAMRAERVRLRTWRRAALVVTAVGVALVVPAPVAAIVVLLLAIVPWVLVVSLSAAIGAAGRAVWEVQSGRVTVESVGTRRMITVEFPSGMRGSLDGTSANRGLVSQEGSLVVGRVPGARTLVVAYGCSRLFRFIPHE